MVVGEAEPIPDADWCVGCTGGWDELLDVVSALGDEDDEEEDVGTVAAVVDAFV